MQYGASESPMPVRIKLSNPMPENNGGIFKLHIHEAKLYRDTEFMGHMDPFVLVEVTPENKEYRTKVLNDAGKNPSWDEILEIPIASLKDTKFKITCYDEDIMMNDFVGQHVFSASELLANGATPTWYDLEFENKQSAEIMLSCEFIMEQSKTKTS